MLFARGDTAMAAPSFQYFPVDNSVSVGPTLRLDAVAASSAASTPAIPSSNIGFVLPFVDPVSIWLRVGNVVSVSFSTLVAMMGSPNSVNMTVPIPRTGGPFTPSTAQCSGVATFATPFGAGAGFVTAVGGTTNLV